MTRKEDKAKLYARKYQDSEEGKRKRIERTNNYNIAYPGRSYASHCVNNALKDGKLIKEPCEVCRSVIHVHGHHDDYSKPLKIQWLCVGCHRLHHLSKKKQK